GTFQTPRTYAVPTSPRAVAVGDLNGDGVLDLALADYANTGSYDGGVIVLLGNRDGTFQAPQKYSTNAKFSFPFWVVLGDFNNDGVPDLAVANYGLDGSVAILLGNGDGTFGAAQNYRLAEVYLETLAVGDFNSDGNLDLVIAN